jgi:hypothetical protein
MKINGWNTRRTCADQGCRIAVAAMGADDYLMGIDRRRIFNTLALMGTVPPYAAPLIDAKGCLCILYTQGQ